MDSALRLQEAGASVEVVVLPGFVLEDGQHDEDIHAAIAAMLGTGGATTQANKGSASQPGQMNGQGSQLDSYMAAAPSLKPSSREHGSEHGSGHGAVIVAQGACDMGKQQELGSSIGSPSPGAQGPMESGCGNGASSGALDADTSPTFELFRGVEAHNALHSGRPALGPKPPHTSSESSRTTLSNESRPWIMRAGSNSLTISSGTGTMSSKEASRMAQLEEQNKQLREKVKLSGANYGGLDKRLKGVAEAVGAASADSVLMTSKPIAAAVCKRRFQVVMTMFAVYCMYLVVTASFSAASDRRLKFSYSKYRMVTLGVRGNQTICSSWDSRVDLGTEDYLVVPPSPSVDISRFGLMHMGSAVLNEPVSTKVDANSVTITYNENVDMDGLYFVTGSRNENGYNDPIYFTFEGSRTGSNEWDLIASSRWNVPGIARSMMNGPELGEKGQYNNRFYATSTSRRTPEIFDFGPIIFQRILDVFDPAIFGAGLAISVLFGMTGFEGWARFTLVASICSSATLHIGLAGWLWSCNLSSLFAKHCILWSYLMFLCSLLIFLERWSVQIMCTITGLIMCCEALGMGFYVTDMFLMGMDKKALSKPLWALDMVAGILCTLFGVLLIVLRWRAVGYSWWLTWQDKAKYDQAWTVAMSLGDGSAACTELQKVVSEVHQSIGATPDVRQKFAVLSKHGMSRMEPLQSLDQLYQHARAAETVLRAKAIQWAISCDGLFQRRKEDGIEYMGLSQEDVDEPEIMELIKWARLKTPERAIEKLLRSYGGDVSRLTDVTRQMLVFEDIASLTKCFIEICKDNDVKIERVKNRMNPFNRHACSGGYRDVNINLRLVSAEAEEVGITNHICEIQLILKSFAELKSEEGHKRYVDYRNTRGE